MGTCGGASRYLSRLGGVKHVCSRVVAMTSCIRIRGGNHACPLGGCGRCLLVATPGVVVPAVVVGAGLATNWLAIDLLIVVGSPVSRLPLLRSRVAGGGRGGGRPCPQRCPFCRLLAGLLSSGKGIRRFSSSSRNQCSVTADGQLARVTVGTQLGLPSPCLVNCILTFDDARGWRAGGAPRAFLGRQCVPLCVWPWPMSHSVPDAARAWGPRWVQRSVQVVHGSRRVTL